MHATQGHNLPDKVWRSPELNMSYTVTARS
jgi:hypothetical protein